MRFSTVLTVSIFAGAASLGGWASTAGAQSAKDSAAYLQAQQMVANGDAAAGRRLADSVAAAAPAGSAAYAEGLYWKATLASNARDSEHDYRQIIVDYPLSGRVPDALLRLGQLESARGENAAALQHFQRLVLEHPLSPLHAEASYWVAKMYFDANDASHACSANADAGRSVRASNVELKNRIDFQQQRCRGVTLAANDAAAPVSVPVDKAPPATPKATEAPRPIAKTPAAEKHDTIARRAPEKHAPEKRATAQPAAKAEVATAPIRQKTVPVSQAAAAAAAPKVAAAAAAAPSDTASALPGAGSGVVSRQPTQEEVDRALASARQADLIRKSETVTTNSTAAVTANVPTATAARARTSATKAAASKTKQPRAVTAQAAEERGSSSGTYTVQVAAFGAKSPATVLAAKLRGRGYNAYVDGSAAPYRVRIGHFATRAAAAAELTRLKAKQIAGFVAER